jgi:hypothetical protein
MSIEDKDLERTLRDLPAPEMSPEARERTLLRMRKAHAAAIDRPRGQERPGEVRMWPTRVRRLAAAVILLAFAIGGLWAVFRGGSAMAMSFADVLRKVRQMSTVRYDLTIYDGDMLLDRVQFSHADKGVHSRQDSLVGDDSVVYDYANKQRLFLTGKKDPLPTATLSDGLHSDFGEEIDALAKLPDTAGKACGTEVVDGRRTEVFEAATDTQVLRIWADIQTGLPVKIRYSPARPKNGDSPSKAFIIVDNIQWNCRFADGTFAMTLPSGYKWASERVAEATPEQLVKMLSLWAELADGRFPDKLDKLSAARFVNLYLEKIGRDFTVDIGALKASLLVPEGTPIQPLIYATKLGLRFVKKVAGQDWHYQGAGIKMGDAASAICWWRDADGDTYHVDYGDLTIKLHSPDDLPGLTLVQPETQPSR